MEALVFAPILIAAVVFTFVLLLGEAAVIGRLWRKDLEAFNRSLRDFREANKDLHENRVDLMRQLQAAETGEREARDKLAAIREMIP